MSYKESSVIANMIKVEYSFRDSNETEVEFKSIHTETKLTTEEETLMDIKQEVINIKDEVQTTFIFQTDGNQNVDDSVPSFTFQKSNKKCGEIEDDFKSIGSDIKLETEDETLMDIKQEIINIKDEVQTTFTFQNDGNQNVDDSIPSFNFQKSNKKCGEIEDDFKAIGSDIKVETEDVTLMDIKQEEINIKDEVQTTFIFQSDSDQDVYDNAPTVSFQKPHQKCVPSNKTHREKLFVCNICEYRSAYKASLTVHIRKHTGEKPFVCDLCEYKSTHKDNLTIHMRKHTGEKPFACGLCEYKSTRKDYLTIHMRKHTGKKPFACGLCDFKSAQKISLTIHMRSHTGENPFVCGLCEYKSSQKSSLTIHMRSHTGEKPFACGLCEYKSTHKNYLTIHMRKHTGEKLFACGLCNFKSVQKNSLTIHMRSHTGEKPFACGLCDFKSAQRNNLTIHMRSHTGEKPFACGLCDFKSPRKANLMKHMKKHLQ